MKLILRFLALLSKWLLLITFLPCWVFESKEEKRKLLNKFKTEYENIVN